MMPQFSPRLKIDAEQSTTREEEDAALSTDLVGNS
jgi:hypothetical protein